MKAEYFCVSDIGNTRLINQDAICLHYIEKDNTIFAIGAVCDGIGGLEHGEIASSIVINKVTEWFNSIKNWIDIKTCDENIVLSHLKDAADEWNDAVRDYQRENLIKTGTTMSVFMLIRDRFYIIQVGDSRVYRYRNYLEQLTVDATVSKMINGKMKTLLSNFIGKDDNLWFSSVNGDVNTNDLFFLCSDGFYHKITQEDIEKVYEECSRKTMSEICSELVQMIKDRGEKDNLSLGLIRITQ